MYITDKNKFNNVKIFYIIEEGMGTNRTTSFREETFIEPTLSELTKRYI
jgi:hypothetical protein